VIADIRKLPALLLLVALFAAAGATARGDTRLADLAVIPAEDGSLAIWLELGPIPEKNALSAPLSARAGDKLYGSAWTAVASPSRAVKLKFGKAGRAYLAATIRADEAKRLYLATGSDVGLSVFLDGRELLRREDARRAQPDTDLVRLDLGAGENLLVLELRSGRKGQGTVYARLLDESFQAPSGVALVLGGAGDLEDDLLAAAARLRLERHVDLAAAKVTAKLLLDFPGGRPVSESATAGVSFEGPGSPEKSDVAVALDRASAGPALLVATELSGDAAPTSAKVAFAGAKLKERVAVRMPIAKAIAEAQRLLDARPAKSDVPRSSLETAEYLVDEVARLIESGDEDIRYLGAEAERALRYAREIFEGRDPLASFRGGIERLGYRSSIDGALHPYGLYVPPGWREEGDKRFGLVVSLHGLNSFPMKALTSLFGVPLGETESKLERERRPLPVGSAPMFAVAPEGFGNSNYFGYGERDVMEVIDRVVERYRIDPSRIYITGASMGGTGALSVPLHFPDRFAAAAPLCGYHSVFEYRAVRGQKLEPWEKSSAARLSNVSYAENGRYLPLHIVHGQKDQPRTSEVLVKRYEELGYDVAFETPDLGHNVWDETYEDRWIFDHFRPLERASHPRRVTFTTGRLRYGGAHWARIDDAADYSRFARIDATWREDGTIAVATENARAITLFADEKLATKGNPRFSIDGTAFDAFSAEDGAWHFHRRGGSWVEGAESCDGICKRAGSSGPIDDIWYEPLLFVYGTADPAETALAKRLAEALSVPRAGVTVRYSIRADSEVSADDIAHDSLVVIGTPQGNSLLAKIQGSLPIRALDGAIEVGGRRIDGETVSAAFIHPNPLNPARYVLVFTGSSREALFYADHLPELLPDWIVYDASSWPTKGGTILDGRKVLAGGFFDREWKLAQ